VPVASWRAGTGSVPAWNQFNAAQYDTPCSRAHSFTFTRTEQRRIHQYDSQHGTTTNPRVGFIDLTHHPNAGDFLLARKPE
jgi:hypothetical protein